MTGPTPNFSGVYTVTQITGYPEVEIGIADKPCWKIGGPGQFVGIWWGYANSEDVVIKRFFKEALDLNVTAEGWQFEVTQF